MLFLGILLLALLSLGFAGVVMWFAGRADRKYLERERLQKVFGESRR